jgi:hypothetical protein
MQHCTACWLCCRLLITTSAALLTVASMQPPTAPVPQQQQQQQQPLTNATVSHKHPRHARPPSLCSGPSCKKMSYLLPQLRFKTDGQPVTCACPDFQAARCFAPGCFPCAKSCFTGLPQLAADPGPFGTGLLCSVGCNPCCQKEGDPDRPSNSACTLVGDC